MEWGSAEHLHLLIEAKKLAFEDRARFYADPEFAAVPVERLVSKDYAAARRALIDRKRAAPGADARRRGGRRRRHGLSRRGRRRRQHGVADPEQLHGLRLRRNRRAVRLRAAEPRLAVRARSAARERVRARQAAVPHDHPGVRDARRAKRCSRSASWARRCSRRAKFRCCRTCSTSGWACRPPATRRACATTARRSRRASRRSRAAAPCISSPASRPRRSTACARAATASSPTGHRAAFGGYQAIQRDLRTGVYLGASESRKDGHAAGSDRRIKRRCVRRSRAIGRAASGYRRRARKLLARRS